jgi:hypothetical protein
MESLQSYGQGEQVYDNKAYTISATHHADTLKMYTHSTAQPNGPGTRPECYMHQLKGWSMTGDKEAFLQGATAFKNATDPTEEHRKAAIARANEMAGQTVEEEEEEEEETEYEEEEGTDDDEVEAESSNTMLNFNCETNPTLSTPIEDEDSDESEASMDGLTLDYRPPPEKGSSSKSHRSHCRKCETGKSSSRRSGGAYECSNAPSIYYCGILDIR